jgi:hypothetical protein
MACGYCLNTPALPAPCPICSGAAAREVPVTPRKPRLRKVAGTGVPVRIPAPVSPTQAPPIVSVDPGPRRASTGVATAPRSPATPAPRPPAQAAQAPRSGQARPAPLGERDLPGFVAQAPAQAAGDAIPFGGEVVAAPATVAWAKMPPAERVARLNDLRADVRNRDLNAAVVRIIRLADPERARERTLIMTEIDTRCLRTNALSAADEATRTRIQSDCINELGFDPRVEDGPRPAANVVPLRPRVATPPALPTLEQRTLGDGALPPLEGGRFDLLDLYVKRGVLTEVEAKEIGMRWMAAKGGA